MTERIENELNETRILVLVAEVVVGFQYQSVFQSGFDRLPRDSQYIKLGALGLMLLAVALLISPAAYHRIVERGRLSARFQRFIARVSVPALLPFAVSLGLDFYVVGLKLAGRSAAVLSGAIMGGTALFFWYGLEMVAARGKPKMQASPQPAESEPTPLKERIRLVLTEARVVLPGAQALLGFQFAAVYTDSFDKLAPLAQRVHFASLAAVALCTIFLMAPAAFHRIVEGGEDTERMHTFSSCMVLASMWFLAPGIAGDAFVVVYRVFHSATEALLGGAVTLAIFWGWWFGCMYYLRARQHRSPKADEAQAANQGTR